MQNMWLHMAWSPTFPYALKDSQLTWVPPWPHQNPAVRQVAQVTSRVTTISLNTEQHHWDITHMGHTRKQLLQAHDERHIRKESPLFFQWVRLHLSASPGSFGVMPKWRWEEVSLYSATENCSNFFLMAALSSIMWVCHYLFIYLSLLMDIWASRLYPLSPCHLVVINWSTLSSWMCVFMCSRMPFISNYHYL